MTIHSVADGVDWTCGPHIFAMILKVCETSRLFCIIIAIVIKHFNLSLTCEVKLSLYQMSDVYHAEKNTYLRVCLRSNPFHCQQSYISILNSFLMVQT